MAYDKIDQLYDALAKDGAVSKGRENFRAEMLAPGEEGYHNRLRLYEALKADGAVDAPTYEEFGRRLGLHAVKPARKARNTRATGGTGQQETAGGTETAGSAETAGSTGGTEGIPDDYGREVMAKVADAVEAGRETLRRSERQHRWQEQNFGLDVPRVEPAFDPETGQWRQGGMTGAERHLAVTELYHRQRKRV